MEFVAGLQASLWGGGKQGNLWFCSTEMGETAVVARQIRYFPPKYR